MIKGVIFDVDGVLLDSMSAWENLGQMYLKHLGISAEADLGEILSPMSLEEAARYLIDHYGLRWKPVSYTHLIRCAHKRVRLMVFILWTLVC